jgi:hypothetical protein
MSKIKTVIQIFPLVQDIDALERTLVALKQSSLYLDKSSHHIILDVTLPLTPYLTDWDNSILKQDFFIDKFNSYKKYADWCDEIYFNLDTETKGCVDWWINNIYKYKEVDNMILLDTDIVFNPLTLSALLSTAQEISKSQSKYIITPECVKLWDDSWDVIANEYFLSHPYGYERQNDPFLDANQQYGDLEAESIPVFKFAGGWFTLYSKELLDYVEFPLDIKGYAPIDFAIMEFCRFLPDAIQYKIKNLVVCEDYTYLNRNPYKKYLCSLDKKKDLIQQSSAQLHNHLISKIKQL